MRKFILGLALWAATALPILAQSEPRYLTDKLTIKDIGRDLYGALKPTFRAQLSPGPIWFLNDPRPFTRPFQFESEDTPTRVVYISEGFWRLANSVAHAKAIDRGEPGFFHRYTEKLSQGVLNTNLILPDLPVISEPRYWTESVLNEQAGYFNQIIGVSAAVDLAHHYLGHYEKYRDRLRDSAIDPATMAGLCSVDQWQAALRLGAVNALECGLGFDGIKAFYECIDGLARRPGWTMYFLPVKVNVAKIKKELDHTEKRFFGQK